LQRDFSAIPNLLFWVGILRVRLDHRNLNEVVSFNPTAENIARWVCEQIPTCFKVEVRESEGNTVIYEKD
jgi:6-pyruvoyltetrahydropterin/6-carboxytetrahydropterin synthase